MAIRLHALAHSNRVSRDYLLAGWPLTFLLHASAHPRITGPVVVETFTTTTRTYGYPRSTLTDNAMVYSTRHARGARAQNRQRNAFEQLLHDLCIIQKNGLLGHPTTQGKIERYHYTLEKWLAAQPSAPTITSLHNQLDTFTRIYNYERPHRVFNRRTPHTVYTTTPPAHPTTELFERIWRI
ncbi:MAG: integrase core domain-containing protein [Actinomycetaceae bacterium]|nr:integrase core domain-containing protein [Actinomycetaceae bacterium]